MIRGYAKGRKDKNEKKGKCALLERLFTPEVFSEVFSEASLKREAS